jgi:iron(III) transport system ATP-binding protein
MNRGHLEQLGTPEEIYESPRSKFVAEFIGLSNFLEGYVQSIEGRDMLVMASSLAVSTPALPAIGPGQKVLLFLRPNEVEILPQDTPVGTNVFAARVDKSTYLGDTMDYRIALGQGVELRVQGDARRRYQAGENVRLRLPRVRSWALTE